MNVTELMSTNAQSCSTSDTLQRAAQLMWENDCGVVPVLDGDGRLVGMLTDRDICMAAYTRGQPLSQIPVTTAMAKQVHGVSASDSVEAAEALMRRAQVHRVPVLDGDGRLKGILSVSDLLHHAHRGAGRKTDGLSDHSIVETMAVICAPRPSTTPAARTAKESPAQPRAN
jgi:CBS domain-containing protein